MSFYFILSLVSYFFIFFLLLVSFIALSLFSLIICSFLIIFLYRFYILIFSVIGSGFSLVVSLYSSSISRVFFFVCLLCVYYISNLFISICVRVLRLCFFVYESFLYLLFLGSSVVRCIHIRSFVSFMSYCFCRRVWNPQIKIWTWFLRIYSNPL